MQGPCCRRLSCGITGLPSTFVHRGLRSTVSINIPPRLVAGAFTHTAPTTLQNRSYHASSSQRAAPKDLYATLGLKRSATKEEIKTKYRELAKKYHPDLNKNDKNASEKFKEISSAYEILEDDQKRAKYDNYGVTDDQQMNGGGGQGDPFGAGGPFAGFGGFGFGGGGFQGGFHASSSAGGEDIFSMFNKAMKQEQEKQGRDVKVSLTISFLEAVQGCNKDVSFQYLSQKPGSRDMKRQTKKVNLDVPKGVESGMTMKMSRQGVEAVVGNAVGDLYIEIDVASDPYFKREKHDIYTEVHVGMAQAALGCTVDVITLDGMVEMKIKGGTQPDSKLLLRDKGVPFLHQPSRRGNHYVTVHIDIPTSLTDRQRQLLEEYIAEETKNPSKQAPAAAQNKTFMEKTWTRLQDFFAQKASSDGSASAKASSSKSSSSSGSASSRRKSSASSSQDESTAKSSTGSG